MAVVMIGIFPVKAAAPRWEAVAETVLFNPDKIENAEGVDVTVTGKWVYIATQEEVTVKVYTILGQLISETKLSRGVYRLGLNTRGIYILKFGSQTRRITV